MKKKESKASVLNLRQQAEELLNNKALSAGRKSSKSEFLKLFHELEVHHIELDLQNAELMVAKHLADTATEKYIELYDFAPTGYFTLSREANITDLNLMGSQMLGKERSLLKNKSFLLYISEDTRKEFNLFFKKVFDSETKVTCEVTLLAGSIDVQLTGVVTENRQNCLITAVNITDQKLAEKQIKTLLAEKESLLKELQKLRKK